MRNFRVLWIVIVLVVAALLAGLGWYTYDQSLPLTAKECRATMFAPVSAKEMGYWNMDSLEADLRECGFSNREIAVWHAGDFAVDYSRGILPTEKGDGLDGRYKHVMLFESLDDIPDYFKTDIPVPNCSDGEYIYLSFVQEVKEDGSWTMFRYNGGQDLWALACVDDLR